MRKYSLLVFIFFVHGCIAPPFIQDHFDNKYKVKERVRQSLLTDEQKVKEKERCNGLMVLYNTRMMCQVYKENEKK